MLLAFLAILIGGIEKNATTHALNLVGIGIGKRVKKDII
jgi:hypothetical protein